MDRYLQSQMRQNCRILAGGKKQNRVLGLRHSLSEDMDGLAVKRFRMRQRVHASGSFQEKDVQVKPPQYW